MGNQAENLPEIDLTKLTPEQRQKYEEATAALQNMMTDDWSDDVYDQMYEKYKSGEIKRYPGHLTEENDKFLEEIQQIPMFMTKQPKKAMLKVHQGLQLFSR